ncbi:hypothetical protein O0I10_003395 [Lichtheimia ornata]|uniref:Uncharacterized protein n=1 Tax=Lichtheimia ornata TaxID=688661 RepID=A0AAD7VA68_9FUNG|nr:uncharacterized protein O0I10_003395 [Lichtheimia ornata]KAJ8660752.1 hypothetical protein O0I10_003395 [Lichtheimia ornata]
MSDTIEWCNNSCTFCDKALGAFNDSLYCSEECLRNDALNHHPLLGYDYAEFKNFPRNATTSFVLPRLSSSSSSSFSSTTSSHSSPMTPPSDMVINPLFDKISPPAFNMGISAQQAPPPHVF